MPSNPVRLLILGEVFTDVHFDLNANGKNLLRLGGIFHSARTANALGVEYALGVISPDYLRPSVDRFSDELNAFKTYHCGCIHNCPNIMLISDSLESGHQGYNDLLRDQSFVTLQVEVFKKAILEFSPTDILIYPGKYKMSEIAEVLKDAKCNIHVDFQYSSDDLEEFKIRNLVLETFIVSTSSNFFKVVCDGSSTELAKLVDLKVSNSILLKENRGGTRYFSNENRDWVCTPSFPTETMHSVGVGDCFNTVFIDKYRTMPVNLTLRLASYFSSFYASSMVHDEFMQIVQCFDEPHQLTDLMGTILAWEERRDKHIYIAAPDFPDVDTTWIDQMEKALVYHNFTPHRPIQENGIITGTEAEAVQLEVYSKDIALLEKCDLLIAVLLYDDPGTYVEIGWFAHAGKRTILFDPYHRSRNLFLRKTVSTVCYTLGEVVDKVFQFLSES